MPSPDAQSQPRRPAALRRNHSSQSSQVSQSPSEGHHAGQHRTAQHKPQRHVVGHGRLGPRNPSYGKNLNKLGPAKLAQAAGGGDGQTGTRHHQRTLSNSSTPTAAEPQPRPGLKRNQSAAVVPRNTSHVGLRKNHSSGHLPRQASSKNIHKATKAELEQLKKSVKLRRRSSPEMEHPVVRFDLGDEEGEDDNAWTEESASQSPATTRSNTRQNSVILEPPKQQTSDNESSDSTTETEAPKAKSQQALSPQRRPSDRVTYSSNQINGASSYHQPQLPDADMITSRILQRSATNRLPPQVSDVSATVVSDAHDARSLSHSTGSTMIDTPGNKEAVSRFINGEDSSGTPRDSNFLPHHRPSSAAGSGDLTQGKRNKSVPNMSAERDTPSSNHVRGRSGTTTPSDLHPSRTQQKLWLQRASSNIEPQQKNDFLQRQGHGGSQIFTATVTYTPSGDVVIDRELLRRFDEATGEYKVVRRFRNPIADAIARLEEYPNSARRKYVSDSSTKRPHTMAGITGTMTPRSSLAGETKSLRGEQRAVSSGGLAGDGSADGMTSRRSRVSFDLPRRSRDDGEVGARRESGDSSMGSEGGRGPKDEAEEVCRRIWERNEVAEGE